MSFVNNQRSTISPIQKVQVQYPVRQIRGISPSGATGAGIPRHVSNVKVSASTNKSKQTTLVTVSFSRDPGDKNFDHVVVLAKGLNGGSTLTAVAQGTDSPLTFTVPNTGQAVSIVVQAVGNQGSAPIATAPSSAVKIATGNFGGFGALTQVSATSLSQLSGTTTPYLPLPDQATFGLHRVIAFTSNFDSTNETMSVNDSGATTANLLPATTTAGASFQAQNGSRWYYGNQAAYWSGRTLTIKGTILVHASSLAAAGVHAQGYSDTFSSVVDPTSASTGGLNPVGVTGYHFVGVKVTKVAGIAFGNFFLVSNNNGTVTSTDSGIPCVDNTRYSIKIVMDSTGATLYLNGTKAATLATVPAAFTGSGMWYHATSATNLFSTFEYLYTENVTP